MDILKIKQFLNVYDRCEYCNGCGIDNGNGKGGCTGREYGFGNSYTYGNGYGYGYSYGYEIYKVDNIPTIFTHIHGNVAKGYILEQNVILKPCYIKCVLW